MDPSRRSLVIAGAVLAGAPLTGMAPARAESLKTGTIDYDSDITLEGYLAYDESIQGRRPGILVAHTKRGIGEFIRERTRELAKLGYVALAVDVFGKGVRPTGDEESTANSQKLKKDRALTRRRVTAGYDLLKSNALVDADRVAIIGYCMGGMVALELARSGAPVLATASFHGTLTTPTPQDAKNIKGRVLVMHGADDRSAPLTEVEAMVKEMREARVPFDLEIYGNTVHGFTEPHNGNDPSKGTAYNEHAAKKSWTAMQTMFNDVFKTA